MGGIRPARVRPLRVSPVQWCASFRHEFGCIPFGNERDAKTVPNIDHNLPFLHLGAPGLGPTNYSSVLTNTSATYCREDPCLDSFYYYEALKITVYTAGNYTIRSSGRLDTVGYLYINTFDPTFPDLNMLQFNDDDGGSSQFLLSMWLETMNTYIVVVTTFPLMLTGAFSITVRGAAAVIISLINATGQSSHKSREYLTEVNGYLARRTRAVLNLPLDRRGSLPDNYDSLWPECHE